MILLRQTIALSFNLADKFILHARRLCLRHWFILRETSRCRRLQIGAGNCFDMPVRNTGSGLLSIGSNNTFGYRMGPRLGNREILIQSRTAVSELMIGSRNVLSNNVSIIATQSFRIGDRVIIYDSDFRSIQPTLRHSHSGPSKPIRIGNNVWLVAA